MCQWASLWVFPYLGIPGSGPAVGHCTRGRVCCEIMSSLFAPLTCLICPVWRCPSASFCIFFRGSCPICSLYSLCLWEEASSASSCVIILNWELLFFHFEGPVIRLSLPGWSRIISPSQGITVCSLLQCKVNVLTGSED